jgi:hypothetical protein
MQILGQDGNPSNSAKPQDLYVADAAKLRPCPSLRRPTCQPAVDALAAIGWRQPRAVLNGKRIWDQVLRKPDGIGRRLGRGFRHHAPEQVSHGAAVLLQKQTLQSGCAIDDASLAVRRHYHAGQNGPQAVAGHNVLPDLAAVQGTDGQEGPERRQTLERGGRSFGEVEVIGTPRHGLVAGERFRRPGSGPRLGPVGRRRLGSPPAYCAVYPTRSQGLRRRHGRRCGGAPRPR